MASIGNNGSMTCNSGMELIILKQLNTAILGCKIKIIPLLSVFGIFM